MRFVPAASLVRKGERSPVRVVNIGAPRTNAEIAPLRDRLAKATRGLDNAADLLVFDVGDLTDADIATVESLARLQLVARAHACRVWLRGASSELRDLLAFVGLADAMPCLPESALEAGRQTEHREEARGIQEERDPADSIARDLEHLE